MLYSDVYYYRFFFPASGDDFDAVEHVLHLNVFQKRVCKAQHIQHDNIVTGNDSRKLLFECLSCPSQEFEVSIENIDSKFLLNDIT